MMMSEEWFFLYFFRWENRSYSRISSCSPFTECFMSLFLCNPRLTLSVAMSRVFSSLVRHRWMWEEPSVVSWRWMCKHGRQLSVHLPPRTWDHPWWVSLSRLESMHFTLILGFLFFLNYLCGNCLRFKRCKIYLGKKAMFVIIFAFSLT